MKASRRSVVVVATALFASGLQGTAWAQPAAYPVRPVRFILPFPPGGGTDILGRILAQELGRGLGQQVVVDNRPGAGANIGAEIAARSAPDGYTMFMGNVAHAVNATLYRKLPYDFVRDFAPVTMLASTPNLLVAHPSVSARTVQELVALAKASPGKLIYASSGSGSSAHLAGELFKAMAGVDIIHIPYKGGNQLVMDVLAGQILLMMNNITTALPHIKAGKLRALGVTTLKRSPAMPELPAIDEAGLPGFENSVWYGVLAPAGTPVPIINRLNSIVVKALNMPDMRERLSNQGAEPVGNTPDESAAQLRADIAKWAKVIKATGAKLD